MKKTRLTLLASLMTALMYAGGQALAGLPNVEVITFLAFVSGYLLGPLPGMAVGACGMGAHSLFNAMGPVAPPMWIAQMVCYALVGLAGAGLGPWMARPEARTGPAFAAAGAGAALTFFYQLVVNAVGFMTFARDVDLWTYVWGGVAFGAVQIVWNAALFFAAAPPTLRVLARYRGRILGKGASS